MPAKNNTNPARTPIFPRFMPNSPSRPYSKYELLDIPNISMKKAIASYKIS